VDLSPALMLTTYRRAVVESAIGSRSASDHDNVAIRVSVVVGGYHSLCSGVADGDSSQERFRAHAPVEGIVFSARAFDAIRSNGNPHVELRRV